MSKSIHYSCVLAGDGAGAAGVSRTGAATCAFGAAGLFTAAERGAGAGRGVGTAWAVAGGGGAAFAGGSGVMMLTGGIDAEVGNSALVGLPVGTDASPDIAARPGAAAAAAAGAFHDDA